ncbi:hypothetical protein RJ55_08258 [Drechmeria coniospora]|nr:hypothetical protein RJ55_08258 [Drechmeria coniospora]
MHAAQSLSCLGFRERARSLACKQASPAGPCLVELVFAPARGNADAILRRKAVFYSRRTEYGGPRFTSPLPTVHCSSRKVRTVSKYMKWHVQVQYSTVRNCTYMYYMYVLGAGPALCVLPEYYHTGAFLPWCI